ncbi:hypothetical protein ONZ43_g7485 [Nemania bipapillata]|uniref:Uncharacterized protein n=1 Tax=Nemania bipapillata TaxID=110536 RepID=A0ACC2HR22_9PEZI|nr:hypothetical protein ONZ43_g7485 [Nemania bipapillata]
MWANSGLGVVTLPDFWQTLHGDQLTVARDQIETIQGNNIVLKSGNDFVTDFVVMCTGWGDHFGMFSSDDKTTIGLPLYGSAAPSKNHCSSINWDVYDTFAEEVVNKKLPFLTKPPDVLYKSRLDSSNQNHWRLYRRAIPIELADKGDRSIVILGQIHTVQTPLVAAVQSFWAILYLLGELSIPDKETMATEASLWNAWTRKRYLGQGIKQPYSLYDFLPYVDTLFGDLKLNSRRKSNPISEMLSPYKPEDFAGFIEEYISSERS